MRGAGLRARATSGKRTGEQKEKKMSWKQSRERQKRLKKISENTGDNGVRGAYYDEKKERIVRLSVGPRCGRMRRISNRKTRRTRKEYAQYGGYRKVFDLWYELF